ncbi:MAG: T9SS type A sorting domain-containing protein, partial [Bacteroidota bacterium]
LGFSGFAHAQIASLGFDTLFPIFPPFDTTAVQDSSFAVRAVRIKNFGNDTLFINSSTPVKFMTQVSQGGSQVSLDSTFNIIIQGTLWPDSTINVNYFEPYNANRFPVGIDVVVIWPKAAGADVHNTITYTIEIFAQTAIAELLAEDGILVYPNPCIDRLSIENKKPLNPIEQVRIYDFQGRLLLSKSRDETIDLSQLPNASYVLELSFRSGTKKSLRFQKQD